MLVSMAKILCTLYFFYCQCLETYKKHSGTGQGQPWGEGRVSSSSHSPLSSYSLQQSPGQLWQPPKRPPQPSWTARTAKLLGVQSTADEAARGFHMKAKGQENGPVQNNGD